MLHIVQVVFIFSLIALYELSSTLLPNFFSLEVFIIWLSRFSLPLFADSLSMSDPNAPKRHRLSKFDEVDCPSPYQDGNQLHRRSMQFEKRAVLLVQELLSLTLEKRLLVDHLTHFRKEFNFSRKVCCVCGFYALLAEMCKVRKDQEFVSSETFTVCLGMFVLVEK